MSRRVRAVAAAAVLAILVVGVPVLLVRLAGWPLPSTIPDAGNVVERLRQGDIPADAVISTIAVVVWLAWLQLMWSVLWETIVNVPRLAAGRTWRPPPLVLSPVGDGVARLFSVILAVGVVTISTPGVATALSTPSGFGAASTIATLDAHESTDALENETGSVAPTPRWRVTDDDDLWSIAEHALGDGALVDQIMSLNPGLTARTLRAGMVLQLPDGAVSNGAPTTDSMTSTESSSGRYVVRDGDGMWNVADALLGDGTNHVEMTRLARGQEVAPGVVFDADTSVIHPGWVFTDEPGDATAEPDTHVVEPGDTLSDIAATELGDDAQWTSIWELNRNDQMGDGQIFDDPDLILPGWELALPPADDTPVDADGTDVADELVDAPDEPAPVDEASDPSAIDPPLVDPPSPTPEPADVPAVEARPELPVADPTDDLDEAPPVVEPVVASTSTTTTTTTEPRVGSSFDAPSDPELRSGDAPRAPSPIRMEYAALLAAGVLTLVGVRRRRALRAALPHARVPAPPPEVASTERQLRTVDAGERAARVDIASRAAAHAVVDTGERIGTIRVAKDGEVLMRFTGDATLPAPWMGSGASWTLPASIPIEMLADDARRVGQPCLALVTVGLDGEGRDVLVDLEAAGTTIIAAQPDQADDVVRAIGAGLATSLNAETIHLVTSSLGTAFLLDHPNVHLERSVAASLATATSLVGSTPDSEQSSFDLRARRTGGETWEPAVLLFAHADDVGADLVEGNSFTARDGVAVVASSSATPIPRDIAGARIVARADGWTLDAFDEQIQIIPIGVSTDDVVSLVAVLDDAARPIEPVPMTESVVTDAVAEPITPLPHDIVVRLMGGVEIVDAKGNHGAFERAKTVELIAWLATHRERATRTGARTALWELDVRDATFANVVSEARRGLGRLTPPPTGQEWLARTLNESLPLHARVVTDTDLIEQRVNHAKLAPPAHAIDVLKPAVAMIHGLPFAGTSYLWPDADGITSNLVLLATTAACELAAHALSMGDTDLVFWATGQGLKVLPGHEELIAFRMRAHARAGDLAGVRSEWESYERVITADSWSDGEPAPKLLDLRRALLTASS